VKKNKPQIRII